MMNVSRLSFVFTRNSKNEVQRDSIDRFEIAQRRVCKSSLASGKLRIKSGSFFSKKKKTQQTLDINVDTD